MAQKKITDLQLISSITDGVNYAVDNGIQTFRSTALQLKDYIIPNSGITREKLAVGAVAPLTYSNKTANYTVLSSDYYLTCDTSGGAITLTMPLASNVSGQVFKIQKTNSEFNDLIIEDSSSSEITRLHTKDESIDLFCDGTNWLILNRSIPSASDTYTMVIGGTTSAPTKGSTLEQDLASYSRQGKNLILKYTYLQIGTAGTSAGSGTYLFPLPAGLEADSSLMPLVGNTGTGVVGPASYRSTFTATGYAKMYDSTNISLELGNEASAPSAVGSSFFAITNTVSGYSFTAVIPISGWND